MDGFAGTGATRVPRPRGTLGSRLGGPSPLPASAVLAAMSDGALLTVNGEIVEVNEALCRLTGRRRAELVGLRAHFPFWPAADHATSFELTSRVLADTRGEVDVTLLRADGSSFCATVSSRAATDGLVVTVIRDVSLDRAQQAELTASRALLAQAQAQAQLGSWSFDVATRILTWSAQMFALMGLRDGDVVPTVEDFLGRVHPEDREHYHRIYVAGIRSGSDHTIEHRIVRPDGTVRHVYGTAVIDRDPMTGRAVTVRGSAQDVTERVLRERALATSEEQFRLTMQHSPIGLALVALDGRWLEVNGALGRIFGQSVDTLLTTDFQSIMLPEDFGSANPMVAELLAGARESFQQDRRALTADGRVAWVSLHVALVRDTSGSPTHFVTQIVDITARRLRAEALERQAGTDPLTGLANRRTWEPALLEHLDGVGDRSTSLVVAILDLDRFKTFNDTFGHPVGDRLLAETSAAWSSHLAEHAPGATLARLGGEEFGLALPGASPEDAVEVVAALRKMVPRGQTASAGITPANPSDDPASLMTRADAALYAAKNQGRDRAQVLLGY